MKKSHKKKTWTNKKLEQFASEMIQQQWWKPKKLKEKEKNTQQRNKEDGEKKFLTLSFVFAMRNNRSGAFSSVNDAFPCKQQQ